MPSHIEFCDECGASLPREAKFCGECGKENPAIILERLERLRSAGRQDKQAFSVLAVVFVGVFLNLLLGSEVDLSTESEVVAGVVVLLGDLTLGVGASLLLVRQFGSLSGVMRSVLGERSTPRPMDFVLAAGVTLAGLAVAFGYVELLSLLESGEGSTETEWFDEAVLSLPWLLLVSAVFPALGEEWLCRGVLWTAIRSRMDRRSAIVLTAIPFAFMHILNGAWVIELPHRFVMGLLLGWLRDRTGSLWPCIAAHFLHNAIAVCLEG